MEWEMDFLNWIDQTLHDWQFLTIFFRTITALGDGGFIWFIIGIVLLCIKKTRPCGLTLLSGLIVVDAVNSCGIKLIVARPRPYHVASGENLKVFVDATLAPMITIGKLKLFGMSKDYAFMSGHAVSSCVCATILYRCNKKLGVPAIILGSLIAISRLYLCVHYPTDILCGAIFGIGGALLVLYTTSGRSSTG
jgi:membrane-associated phospholipid phosphatase